MTTWSRFSEEIGRWGFALALWAVYGTAAVLLLVAFDFGDPDHLFSPGPEEGPGWRDWLEVAYFVLSGGSAMILVWLLLLTRRQVEAAYGQLEQNTNTNEAQFFVTLNDRWKSPEMQEGVASLWRAVDLAMAQGGDPYLNIRRYMTSPSTPPEEKEAIVNLLRYFESLGLMVRNGFIALKPTEQIIGSLVIRIHEYLSLYIFEKKRKSRNKMIYENFDLLAAEIRAARGIADDTIQSALVPRRRGSNVVRPLACHEFRSAKRIVPILLRHARTIEKEN